MTTEFKLQLCEEIDAFLAVVKWLRGYMPELTPCGRRNQMVSCWPVVEEGRNESRAHLVFSIFGSAQDQPSVSLICRNWEVFRVDVKPNNDRDFNPEYALRFGLPKVVFGDHIHLWERNREYVQNKLSPDRWRIPAIWSFELGAAPPPKAIARVFASTTCNRVPDVTCSGQPYPERYGKDTETCFRREA